METQNRAQFINQKLGVKLFREDLSFILALNKFTPSEIRELCIDDLVLKSGKSSSRLSKLTDELTKEYVKDFLPKYNEEKRKLRGE